MLFLVVFCIGTDLSWEPRALSLSSSKWLDHFWSRAVGLLGLRGRTWWWAYKLHWGKRALPHLLTLLTPHCPCRPSGRWPPPESTSWMMGSLTWATAFQPKVCFGCRRKVRWLSNWYLFPHICSCFTLFLTFMSPSSAFLLPFLPSPPASLCPPIRLSQQPQRDFCSMHFTTVPTSVQWLLMPDSSSWYSLIPSLTCPYCLLWPLSHTLFHNALFT